MKPLYLTAFFFFVFGAAFSQEGVMSAKDENRPSLQDSNHFILTHNKSFIPADIGSAGVAMLFQKTVASKVVLYTTKNGRYLEAYYFPGQSDKNALVIGGMHGSELSSIAVAKALIVKLATGQKPFYNVVIVPCLFPDNASEAAGEKKDRVQSNTGRYTSHLTADPNRQMPPPGKPFNQVTSLDAQGREIEGENQALLQLIQRYEPSRLINIHAIRDRSKAGVFADPRTDCSGYALGYESDKALALLMADYIQSHGAPCPGNMLSRDPTALYHLDPAIAAEGEKQQRSVNGSQSAARGQGISLGTWSSTAVCDPAGTWSRPAIRTFTMEFPGYLLPSEYRSKEERNATEKAVQVYAASISHLFLQANFVEDQDNDEKLIAKQ